jgi:hypothetical protein
LSTPLMWPLYCPLFFLLTCIVSTAKQPSHKTTWCPQPSTIPILPLSPTCLCHFRHGSIFLSTHCILSHPPTVTSPLISFPPCLLPCYTKASHDTRWVPALGENFVTFCP